jgi:hypothetical protein
MSEDRYTERLGDYVDGTLDEAERRLFASHLSVCESCRTLAEDLLEIKKSAGSLPRLTPPDHLWQRIENALSARQRRTSHSFSGTFSNRWAMAASILLIIGLGFLSWRYATQPEPSTDDPAELASYITSELEQAEKHYENAISGLEQIVVKESRDEPLDPEVMAVLNDNMDLIEQAIGESRAAALEDPDNESARESLLGALKTKLNLLQNTILLINEVRKGRGETAYDLLEEMREAQSSSDPM